MDLVQQGRPCRWWMDWVHVCLFVVVRLVCDLVDSTGSAGDRHPRRWRRFIQPGGRVRASAGHGHWRGAGRLGRWRFRWLQLTYWQFINVVSLSLLQLFLDSTRWWIRTSTTPLSSTRAKWVSAGMAWPKHRSQRLFLSSRQTPPTRNSRFSKSTTTIAKRSNSVSTTSLWQTTSSTGKAPKKNKYQFFSKIDSRQVVQGAGNQHAPRSAQPQQHWPHRSHGRNSGRGSGKERHVACHQVTTAENVFF